MATVAFNFFAGGPRRLDHGQESYSQRAPRRVEKNAPPSIPPLSLASIFCASTARNRRSTTRACGAPLRWPWTSVSIVEKITRAGELPATSFVPPGIAGYESPDGISYDPEAARRLLAEAGYPDGKGFPLTTFLYNESQQNRDIAVELQAMWLQHLGVKINLALQEWKVYLNSLSSLDYGIARSSWVGDYPDPNTFLDMFVTGNGNNRTGWSDPTYDRLIADAGKGNRYCKALRDSRPGRSPSLSLSRRRFVRSSTMSESSSMIPVSSAASSRMFSTNIP